MKRILATIIVLILFSIVASAEINLVPTSNIRINNDTEYSTNSATYISLVTVPLSTLSSNITNGTLNFSFYMRDTSITYPSSAILRKNGINIGVEQTQAASTESVKIQFITGMWNKTDIIEVYGKMNTGSNALYISNSRISYDSYFNLTSGNTTLAVRTTNLSYFIQRSNSTITENDGNQSTSFFLTQKTGGTLESSLDYDVVILSNTSNSVSVLYNTSVGNETLNWTIVDANTVNISRQLNVTSTTGLVVYEQVIPLLTDTRNDTLYPRYDLVWLNKTLAANDIKMWTPYIAKDGDVSGIHTRYARYDSDFGVIVSSRNWNQYFRLNMSGTSSLMSNASARQTGDTNLTQSKYNKFHLGFVNRTAYNITDLNNPEASVPITSGTTLYQNISYEFHDNSIDWISGKMLPDGNPIVNFTRFTDLNEFPNQTIGKEARFAATAIIGERIYSLYYPNETAPGYPAIYDSANTYNSFTSPSASRAIQGNYYFANSSGKQVMQLWYDGIENWNQYYKLYPITKFEGEKYLTLGAFTPYFSAGTSCSNTYGNQTTTYLGAHGAPAQINFTGDTLIIGYTKQNEKGVLNISIDGTNYSLDQYSSSAGGEFCQEYTVPAPKLDYNPGINPNSNTHNVKFYHTGNKTAASSGTQVQIDYVKIRRNDTGDQLFGYFPRQDSNLDSDISAFGDHYFNETLNITINGTTYPYSVTLYQQSYDAGATAFTIEYPLALYTIYKTDGYNQWVADRLPMMERHMKWIEGMYIEPSTNLWRNHKLLGESAYHDNIMSTGYRGAEGSVFVLDSDIMAQIWGAAGNSTNQNYWITRRDLTKNQMIKDWSEGGVWKNETVGGHFVDSLEPGPVRYEVENIDFINRDKWLLYEQNTIVNASYNEWISGVRLRPWNSTQDTQGGNGSLTTSLGGWNPSHRYLYYVNNDTNPITWNFNGTGISSVVYKNYNYGIVNYTIDGINYTVDLYATGPRANQIIPLNLSLPQGMHNITIHWTGTKNASATGTSINADAFEVYNASIPGMQIYSLNAFTLDLFPAAKKQAVIDWIQWHEGNGTYDDGKKIYTDWLYPHIPVNANLPGTQTDSGVFAWGYHFPESLGDWAVFGFENGGHFPGSGAFMSRLTGNYSDMWWYGFGNGDFKKKESLRESYYPNGSTGRIYSQSWYNSSVLYKAGLDSATIYEDQMSGMWMTGYATIWSTASYAAASDTTPPNSITNPQTIVWNFGINNTWINPIDPDFNYVMFRYSNGTLLQNVSTPANFLNISYSQGYSQTISAQTVDLTGNVNTTLVWFNNTVLNYGQAPEIDIEVMIT